MFFTLRPLWNKIRGKPSTFPASAHTHAQSDVTNLESDLATKADLESDTQSIQLLELKLFDPAEGLHGTISLSDGQILFEDATGSLVSTTIGLTDLARVEAVAAGYVPRITSIDNRLTRFDGIIGAVQGTGIVIDDSNNISPASGTMSFFTNSGASLQNTTSGIGLGAGSNALRFAVFDNSLVSVRQDGAYGFSSNGQPGPLNPDIRISRNAAGVVQIGTTTNNAAGSLLLTNLTASGRGTFGGATGASNRQISLNDSVQPSISFQRNNVEVWVQASDSNAFFLQRAGLGNVVSVSNSATTDSLVVSASSNTLIGTATDPGTGKLHVAGGISTSGRLGIGSGVTVANAIDVLGTDAASSRLRLTRNISSVLHTAELNVDGVGAAYVNASTFTKFAVNGIVAMEILANRNVSINNALTVSGTTTSTGVIYGGIDGTTSGYLRLHNATAGREANIYARTSGGLVIDTAGNAHPIQINGSQIIIGAASDISLSRHTVETLQIGNGSVNALGNLRLKDITATGTVTTGGSVTVQETLGSANTPQIKLVANLADGLHGIDTRPLGSGSKRGFQILTDGATVRVGGGVATGNTDNSGVRFGDSGGTGVDYSGIRQYGILGASSGTQQNFAITTGISQTGTAGFRCVFVSPFISATGSGTKLLLDLGTNSVSGGLTSTHTSVFSVGTTGNVIAAGTLTASGSVTSAYQTSVSDPSGSDIPAGSMRAWLNTSTDSLFMAANVGGTIRKAAFV